MDTPRKREFIATVVILLFGLFVVFYSWSLPIMGPRSLSPGIFPLTMGIIMVLCAFASLIKMICMNRDREQGIPAGKGTGDVKTLFISLLLLAGYAFLLPIVHFIAATIIYLILQMVISKRALSLKILLIAVSTPPIVYLLFDRLFLVKLP